MCDEDDHQLLSADWRHNPKHPLFYHPMSSYEEKKLLFEAAFRWVQRGWCQQIRFYNGDDYVLTVYFNIFGNQGKMYQAGFRRIDEALGNYERGLYHHKVIYMPQTLRKDMRLSP